MVPCVHPNYGQLAMVAVYGLAMMMGILALVLVSRHRRQHNQAIRDRQLAMEHARDCAESASRVKCVISAVSGPDMNTLINRILGGSGILQRSTNLDDKERDTVNIVAQSGSQLLDLIRGVRDLLSLDSGHMKLQEEFFDLREMTRELSIMIEVELRKMPFHWRVEIDCDDDSLSVRGDEAKLRQVITTLIFNAAIKNSSGEMLLRISKMDVPPKSRPAISSKTSTKSNLKDTTLSRDREERNLSNEEMRLEWFRFDIVDTEIGIEVKDRQAIVRPSQPSTRAKSMEDLGLDMSLANGYVKLMGGCLNVISKPEKGPWFCLLLPLVCENPSLHACEAAHDIPGLQNGICLEVVVVDHVCKDRSLLCRTLRQMGCTVVSFDSAVDAVAFMESHPPRVIFINAHMPGMDGVESLRQIRALFEDGVDMNRAEPPRSIAVSTSFLEQEHGLYLEFGFDEVITKPVELERIKECLARVPGVRFA